MTTCTELDCERPAHAQGLCDSHYRRKLRGYRAVGSFRSWGRPARARREAALAYADAETDEDFDRAEARLRMATRRALIAARRGPGRRANKVPSR